MAPLLFSPYKYLPERSFLPKPEQTSLLFQNSAEFVAGLYLKYSPGLSFEELLKLGSDKYTVKLKSFPSGINQIRIVPEQVDFLIEQITSNVD